ncbi:hypothetical protein [Spirochaeta dissipatitropha]
MLMQNVILQKARELKNRLPFLLKVGFIIGLIAGFIIVYYYV